MIFLLGVACIVDALAWSEQVIPQLLVGAALVGILPLDELVNAVTHRPGRLAGHDPEE